MAYPLQTAKTIGLTLFLTLLTVGFAASLVMAVDVYLLIFLAILCAVAFANLASWLGKVSPLPYVGNLAITVSTILLLAMGTIALLGLRIEAEIQNTSDSLDQSFTDLETWLHKHPPVKAALGRVPMVNDLLTFSPQPPTEAEGGARRLANRQDASANTEKGGDAPMADANRSRQSKGMTSSNSQDSLSSTSWGNVRTMSSVGRVFGAVGKLFSTTFGVAMNVAFVLFVGGFLAIKPHFYRDNFSLLFPPARRERVVEILDDVGDMLFNWLQGRVATMAITGFGTGIVLWLLGVPLALTLGVITGLLTFIPNIGGLLALMLSMMVASSQGPSTVMWVVAAYVVLQFVESNVITPLIQQHQTAVPPPILLAAQLMMGVLTGFLGVLVATPLVAAGIVLVREAYVKDVLGNGHGS